MTLLAIGSMALMAKRASRAQRPEPWQRGDVSGSEAANRDEPPAQQQPSRPAQQSSDRERDARDAEHQKAERRFWTLNLVVTVAAAFGTGAAAWYAYGAFTQARRQADIAQDALVASNRAWLDLKVEIASDLKPQSDGENIAVRVSAQNFGHSPAIGAYLSMEFHANHLFEGPPGGALKKACNYGNTAALASLTKAGRLVVPGAPVVWERSATASNESIDDALRSINGQDKGKTTTSLPVISVLICVTYMTPEDTKMHQTAITRDVFRRATNSETGMRFLARGNLIPKSDLVLSDFIPGDYAD